jgi:hypothetical protein
MVGELGEVVWGADLNRQSLDRVVPILGATRLQGMCGAIRNLGSHDLDALGAAFRAIDDTRQTVVFAYTVKVHGHATEGLPQNHWSLLTVARCWTRPAPRRTRRRAWSPSRPTSARRPTWAAG